jgi:hypothetical protein
MYGRTVVTDEISTAGTGRAGTAKKGAKRQTGQAIFLSGALPMDLDGPASSAEIRQANQLYGGTEKDWAINLCASRPTYRQNR